MTIIDISQAPTGATHYHHKLASPWLRLNGDRPQYHHPDYGWTNYGSVESGIAHITEAIRIQVPAQAWNGQGLPPVGTVCEVVNVEGNTFTKQFRGKSVRIIAHTRHDDTQLAVFRVESGPIKEWDARYHALVAMCFRPLRTPEQIAADARCDGIESMCEIVREHPAYSTHNINIDCSAAMRLAVEALYDAGYRLVEGGAQ